MEKLDYLINKSNNLINNIKIEMKNKPNFNLDSYKSPEKSINEENSISYSEIQSTDINQDYLFQITDNYINSPKISRFKDGFISNGSNNALQFNHLFINSKIKVENRMILFNEIYNYCNNTNNIIELFDIVEDNNNPFIITVNIIINNDVNYEFNEIKKHIFNIIESYSDDEPIEYSLIPNN